jgi:hypothetical protein
MVNQTPYESILNAMLCSKMLRNLRDYEELTQRTEALGHP